MMPGYTAASVRSYLREHFISLDDLAKKAGLKRGQVLNLIEYHCIPKASYTVSETQTISSDVFGAALLVEKPTEQYFPLSEVSWIRRAQQFPETMPLEDIARNLKAAFRSEYREAIVCLAREKGLNPRKIFTADGSVNEAVLERYFEDTWQEWRNGTYGVCVRQADSVERIAKKQIAVQDLEQLTHGGAKDTFTGAEIARVRDAIMNFDDIAMPFAPHDVAISSRQRLVNQVRPRLKKVDSALTATPPVQ